MATIHGVVSDLGDLRSAGWTIDPSALETENEGYYACVSTPARSGIVQDCLAALDRHGVSLRWLSFFREDGPPARRWVALVTTRCTAERVRAALGEIAPGGERSSVVPVRHVHRV